MKWHNVGRWHGACGVALVLDVSGCSAEETGSDGGEQSSDVVVASDLARLAQALGLQEATAAAPVDPLKLAAGACHGALIANAPKGRSFTFRPFRNGAVFFAVAGGEPTG